MNKLFIYTELEHPRLSYVVGFIQQFCSDFEWEISHSKNDYHEHKGIRINYSKHRIETSEFFVENTGWLTVQVKEYHDVTFRNEADLLELFPCNGDIGFDVFAALFYLLSRVEEYLASTTDEHGRFTASQSLLFRTKTILFPIADIWVHHLFKLVQLKTGIELKILRLNPAWSLGIDVDQFFKYKHKSIFKTVGGLFKALCKLKVQEFKQRIEIVFSIFKDPYDSFQSIKELEIPKNQLLFFILSGGDTSFDKNHSLQHNVIQAKLKQISEFATIGLHPSYSSNEKLNAISEEKKNLEKALGFSITQSRQHYLKIHFPETYRLLISAGIEKDFSLGYSDYPGFRAGTCRPFYWYDLERESQTRLLIVPSIAMDRTLLDYMKLDPQSSEELFKKLFDRSITYGGHFHLIWHNSSFDFDGEWKDWNQVLLNLIRHFKANQIN